MKVRTSLPAAAGCCWNRQGAGVAGVLPSLSLAATRLGQPKLRGCPGVRGGGQCARLLHSTQLRGGTTCPTCTPSQRGHQASVLASATPSRCRSSVTKTAGSIRVLPEGGAARKARAPGSASDRKTAWLTTHREGFLVLGKSYIHRQGGGSCLVEGLQCSGDRWLTTWGERVVGCVKLAAPLRREADRGQVACWGVVGGGPKSQASLPKRTPSLFPLWLAEVDAGEHAEVLKELRTLWSKACRAASCGSGGLHRRLWTMRVCPAHERRSRNPT